MEYAELSKNSIEKLLNKKGVKILALESSCDETAASVVEDGRRVLSHAMYSQIKIHEQYGGVVPEIASRKHLEKIPFVVESALKDAGLTIFDCDALAVTYGPGLVGALLTTVSYAKAASYAAKKPLIPVNHIEGHIAANYISYPELEPPFICLVVSGGHTEIVVTEDYGKYRLLGSTRDDAAGEAFDKVARVLGLSYPGGPHLQKLAEEGDDKKYKLPKSFRGETHLDFSFSGIKTAVINLVHGMEQRGEEYSKADVAASFQRTVVEELVKNTFEAAKREGIKKVAIAGGVSANAELRRQAKKRADKDKVSLYVPKFEYCTDNAAMIGAAAYYSMKQGAAGLELNAVPSLDF
ncbi:MAG: tRNA (adenosine(37)-N6)-threonylcarbamoyltransferase complex transferase subunit TsaD [Christensenellaceae bacterium]|nr:tRNA (adenosine(37)-N6)-threonylcarbamoyltransferase complex transferase subunit TsaD [Christensenellaceae bacterium]